MGSTMKPTIFNDRVANAIKKWHLSAKKHLKHNKNSPTSVPGTPLHSMSPVHLLRHYQSEHDVDSAHTLQRMSYFDADGPNSSPSPHQDDLSWSNQGRSHGQEEEISAHESNAMNNLKAGYGSRSQHEIQIHSAEFTFEKSERS